MKNIFKLHSIFSLLVTSFFVFALSKSIYAQIDDPLIDRVPLEWLENINYSDSYEDVITDNDGYDNFNLGVDFAEPHLSQNPNNPLHYFGAYNINGAWHTTDGTNWVNSIPNFGTPVNGDPGTAYDGVGNLYYESMFGGVTGCKVMRSTDNGLTWSAPVTAISGNDKNWLAADQTSGPYANFVYTVMTPGNFARSTNFGATWTTTATFATQSLPGMMVCVGPNGTTDGGAVYVVTNSGNAFASTYTFYVSNNGGLSFTLKSAQNFANYVGTNVNGRNSVQNMRTRPYPFITADQSNGTYRGRVYCIFASNTPSGNGNKPDIFCRYSNDQGTTWSLAFKINDDLNSQNHHQWHPSVWCDKSTGRLYVKWMDTRDTPSSDSAYIYASYSDDGGVTWASNKRISTQKMKIDCLTCGGGGTPRYQGDYDAIVSTNNQALIMWTDFRARNFGSYVAYFPDFAMKILPSTSNINYNSDSTFININVPSVKLYNSSAIFSATVSPLPSTGSIILDFPQGNTLNSFPGSVNLRIRTTGNVSLGTYTINIKGEGPNGTPVHHRSALVNVELPILDFGSELFTNDNCNNTFQIIFGTAPGAGNCIDPGLDVLAPPPPPLGAFDSRFISCNEGLFTDIKATNTSTERIWDVHYQPAENCSPVSLSWNPSQLPPDGYFHLIDPILGTLVNVNMRTTNSFTDLADIRHLQIKYNYQFCSNFNIASSWNLVSLPVEVTNNNYLTLFPNATPGTLYGYAPAGYYSTQTVSNCTGYWLKFEAPQFVPVCGSDRIECVVNLNAGWNIIGGPNCNVPLSTVSDPGTIIIPGTLYGYSAGYQNSNSINATKAYWVKTTASGTITISCGSLLAKPENEIIITSEILDEFSRIEITDAQESNQTLYFNGEMKNNLTSENFSLPPLPPSGSFDARLTGDYRLTESEEATILIQTSEFPINLTISNINFEEGYVIQEIANGVEVNSQKIIDGEKIIISNEQVTMLKITKQQTSLPTSFNLEQNYPNPFNPSTTIKFSLPETSNVTLNIYNTLGQKVTELVNNNLEAGWYSCEWNAGNAASGIYIYELRTDKFVSLKKMILLK